MLLSWQIGGVGCRRAGRGGRGDADGGVARIVLEDARRCVPSGVPRGARVASRDGREKRRARRYHTHAPRMLESRRRESRRVERRRGGDAPPCCGSGGRILELRTGRGGVSVGRRDFERARVAASHRSLRRQAAESLSRRRNGKRGDASGGRRGTSSANAPRKASTCLVRGGVLSRPRRLAMWGRRMTSILTCAGARWRLASCLCRAATSEVFRKALVCLRRLRAKRGDATSRSVFERARGFAPREKTREGRGMRWCDTWEERVLERVCTPRLEKNKKKVVETTHLPHVFGC